MSPTCHSYNTIIVRWREFFWECSQSQFQTPTYNTFWDKFLKVWQTDGQTDRQTDRKRCIRAHRAICTGGLNKRCLAKSLLIQFLNLLGPWSWGAHLETVLYSMISITCLSKRVSDWITIGCLWQQIFYLHIWTCTFTYSHQDGLSMTATLVWWNFKIPVPRIL